MVAINSATPGDAGVSRRLREGQAQLPHLGRYRHRQDHHAERAVVVHPRGRARRHHRGRRRAAAAAAARRAPGDAAPRTSRARGEMLARDLVKNALRMRPDRIVIGECRGGEVLDMLQAMNTGHEGSMTTVHANTPRDALSRVEAMVGMGGIQMSEALVRQTIARSLNIDHPADPRHRRQAPHHQHRRDHRHAGRRHHHAGDLQVRADRHRRRREDRRQLHASPASGRGRSTASSATASTPPRSSSPTSREQPDVKIILIGVLAFTAVAVMEALAYTLRFLSPTGERTSSSAACRRSAPPERGRRRSRGLLRRGSCRRARPSTPSSARSS